MAGRGMKGLFEWCKKHTAGYNDVKVTNMTSSWKDGLAFCALIHRFRPDLIDFDSLSKENVLYNNELAFSIAEKHLDIAALLDAEDMANMKSPDKLSVMTYLSQYYNCFRNQKPGEMNHTDVAISNPENVSFNSAKKLTSEEGICFVCRKHVHLVQRYFDGGKLYHRTCHREDSLKNIRATKFFSTKSEREKENIEREMDRTDSGVKSHPTQKNSPERNNEKESLPQPKLPGLIQTLSQTPAASIRVARSDLSSPVTEEHKPLQDPMHIAMPSLISELQPESPRPRARTIHMQYKNGDVQPEVTGNAPKPPVARPRSKTSSVEQDDSSADEHGLNPFEMESGSDSDTTLSSTSSEDDENNPFNISFKPSKMQEESKKSQQNVKIGEKDNKINIKEQEEDENECTNPFGDVESEEETIELSAEDNYKLDRFNPFSENFEEEKKKKRAPPPPARPLKSPTKSPPGKVRPPPPSFRPTPSPVKTTPGSPARPLPPSPAIRTTPHSPTSKPSPINVTPIPPVSPKFTPSAGKKKRPPPPRPDWQESAKEKMEQLNSINNRDPRYAKNQLKPIQPKTTPTRQNRSPLAAPNKEKRPTRAAPGYGYPLIKRKVHIKMSEEEITNEMKILDLKLSDLEVKGVKLEEMLRFAMEKDMEWTGEEDELLQEWFELVNKKNKLMRFETDLVFQMKQQHLEQEHADIEFQLRKIFNKPDATKTEEDKMQEEKLLERLIKVVENRNVIVNSIEEERIKEAEEDAAYQEMKKLHDKPNTKKKKHKVKKMFSKRGSKKRKPKNEA